MWTFFGAKLARKAVAGALLLPLTAFSYEIPSASTPVPAPPNASMLKEMSKALSAIAANSRKALVFVSISKTLERAQPGSRGGQIDPFEFFFGDPYAPQIDPPKQQGLGSGFFIDIEKGYILTNNHVVEGADTISLKLANNKTYEGKILGRDKNTDVAVVQITDKNFNREGVTSLVLGNSDELENAEFVLAIGAPFGLEASVSLGIVSAKGRGSLQITQMGDFLQTDAAINPGNSGGPLIDMDGKVIGINSAIFSRSGGYNGIGFAVPSNLARRIATSLINEGHSNRGFLGVSFRPLEEEWVESLGLPKGTSGVIVAQVTEGGPADKAGLETGDVITNVEGKDIADGSELTNVIGLMAPGSEAKITYFHEGKKKTTAAKIQMWPGKSEPVLASNKAEKGKATNTFGLSLAPVSSGLKQQYRFQSKHGLVVTQVEPNSPAARARLSEGDVITNVNGKKVAKESDFEALTSKEKQLVILQIERGGSFYIVPLKAAS